LGVIRKKEEKKTAFIVRCLKCLYFKKEKKSFFYDSEGKKSAVFLYEPMFEVDQPLFHRTYVLFSIVELVTSRIPSGYQVDATVICIFLSKIVSTQNGIDFYFLEHGKTLQIKLSS